MPRRARLDRNTVVQAAAEIANLNGIEALTLGRLAEQLGIQTPSLYNHVNGLPGLYRDMALMSHQMLGQAIGDAAIGKAGPDALIAIAEAYRAFIKEHSGLYMASLRTPRIQIVPDAELEAAEERVVMIVVAVMNSFGLKGDDAIHAVRGLRSVVHGFATLEVAGGFGIPLDCDESFRRLVQMLIAGLQQTR